MLNIIVLWISPPSAWKCCSSYE